MALNLRTLTPQEQVAAIYIGYFDRAPEPYGSAFWEGAVATMSLEDIATDFSTQDETRDVHPFFASPSVASANAFIAELYLNLFNREPDAAGLDFWSGVLQEAVAGEGTVSVGEIILQIIQGAQNTAAGNDLTTILNKIEVATAWTDAAEAAGLTRADSYSKDPALQVSAKTILDAVTDEDSSVAGAKADVVAALPPLALTLTVDAPSVTETDAAAKTLTFTLTLDEAPSADVVVSYAVASSSTATAGDDFVTSAGAVTFSAGQTTAQVAVTVLADDLAEGNEGITLSFSGDELKNTVVATGTIIDDDAAFVFSSTAAPSVAEGSTSVVALAGSDADGSSSTVEISGGADAAQFSIVGSSVVFNAAPDFEAPADADGDNVYEVTVTATDEGGNTTDQTISVTVTDVNDEAPVISSGATGSVDENADVATVIYTAASTDADAGDTVSYSVSGADAAAVSINAAGEVTLNASADFETQSSYSFDVVATDAGGNASTQAVTVSVGDVNEAPAAVADGPFSVVTGNSITMDVLANDTDVDAGASLAISGTPTATVGTVSVNGDGELVYAAPAGFQGDVTISYAITDGTNVVEASQVVTVSQATVTAATSTVSEGDDVVFNIKGAPNTDYSVVLDGTGVAEIADATVTVTTDANGDATITRSTTADRTTEGNGSVTAYITGTTVAPVSVTVEDTSLDNVAPVAVDATASVNEGGVITGQLTATDADAEDAGDHTFTTTDVVPGFTLNADGSYSFDATQPSLNVLPEGLPSTLNINYTVSDNATDAGNGALTDTGTLVITVTGTNDAPTVTVANAAPTVNEGTTAVTTITTSDVDAGDTVSSVTLSGADAALFQTVGNQLSFKTAPDYDLATDANADGVYEVTLSVTDSNGGSASESVTVTVADAAEPDQTFVLTRGSDNFTGADGDDTFTAAEVENTAGDGTLPTWTTGDALDGGDGDDTLNITQEASVTAPLGATITGIETINITQGGGTSEGDGSVTETAAVTFQDLAAGQTVTIAGVTFTAGDDGATAAQIADAFVTTSVTAGAVTGGTLSESSVEDRDAALSDGGYTAAAGADANSVVFTSTTAATNVTNLLATGTAVTGTTSTVTYEITTQAAEDSTISFTVNGTTAVTVPASATSDPAEAGSAAADATAIANAINQAVGAEVATVGTGDDAAKITITSDTPVGISGLTDDDPDDATDTPALEFTTTFVTGLDPAAPTIVVTDGSPATTASGVTLDATGYTGTTALNVTNNGTQTLTAAATTNITSVNTAQAANDISVDGGNAVTVTSSGQTTGEITIGATTAASGAVTVTADGGADNATMGNIAVTGGTTVSVTQTATDHAVNSTATQGDITVTGGVATTTVAVTQSASIAADTAVRGVANGAVVVEDGNEDGVADTITTVSLSNYGDSTTVDSGVLSTLNLSGTAGSVVVNGGVLSADQTATTLNLNLVGLSVGVDGTGGNLADNVVALAASDGNSSYTTVNLDASTTASNLSNLNIADGGTAQVAALNISGDAALTLGNQTALTSAAVITSTNTAGVTLSTALAAGQSFAGGTGGDSISLSDAATVAYTMGDGDDTVTYGGAVGTGGSVAAGDGDDTIIMSSAEAAAADADGTFNSTFTGFEILEIEDALGDGTDLDTDLLNNVNHVVLAADTEGDSTLSNMSSGAQVDIQAARFDAGAGAARTDTLTVEIVGAGLAEDDVVTVAIENTTGINAGIVSAAQVETINVVVSDASTEATGSTAVRHTLDLTDSAYTTVNISGNNGLILTADGTKLTTFDASGVVANGDADTSDLLAVSNTFGALEAASVITGGAGDDALNAAAAVAGVTLTGGAGDDALTGSSTVSSVISGGAGDDTLTGGAAADTITGGAGTNTYVFSSADVVEQVGGSTTSGVAINLGSTALTYVEVNTASGAYLAGTQTELAANTSTYLFSAEDNTNASVVDTLSGIANATGTNLADFIVGSDDANVITGGAGADTIDGGAGSDNINFASVLLDDGTGGGTATAGTALDVGASVGVDAITFIVADDQFQIDETVFGDMGDGASGAGNALAANQFHSQAGTGIITNANFDVVGNGAFIYDTTGNDLYFVRAGATYISGTTTLADAVTADDAIKIADVALTGTLAATDFDIIA